MLLQMTASTYVSVPDLVAVAGALGVPCSPEAASCILQSARSAGQAKGGGSSNVFAKQAAPGKDCIIHVKVRAEAGCHPMHEGPIASAQASGIIGCPDEGWCQALGPDIPGMPTSMERLAALLMLEGRTDRTAAAAHALKQSAVHRDPRFSDVAGVHWHVHVLCSRGKERFRFYR